MASHSESASAEQVHCSSEVQDGDVIQYPSPPQEGTLGNVRRPEGRLPPHPGSSRGPALPLFRLPRPTLPFCSDAFRSVYSTADLHSGHQSFGGFPSQVRGEDLHVSGRLANCSRVSGSLHRCNSRSASGVPGPGVDYQPREVISNSVAGTSVPGSEIGFPSGACVTDRRENFGPTSGSRASTLCSERPGSLLVSHSGLHVQPGGYCSFLSSQNATAPVASAGLFSASFQGLPNSRAYDSRYRPSSSLVDNTGERSTGGSLSISSLRGYTYNRRLVRRLGSVYRGSFNLRPLVSSSDVVAHQPPRTGGGSLCSTAFSPSCQGKESVGSDRQHNGSGLYQPAGRNSFVSSLAPDLVSFPLGYRSGNRTPGGSPPGVIQRQGRRSFAGNSLGPDIGLDAGPRDFQSSLRQVQCVPGSRSVCVAGERTGPSVLFPSSGTGGVEGQCPVLPLGRLHLLRLSSSCTSSPCSSESERRGNPVSPSDSPLLAVSTVVFTTVPPIVGSSCASSVSPRSTSVTRTRSISAGPIVTSSCGVASIRESFRQEGLSDEAASMAARGRRASTLRLYNRRLGVYGEWCSSRQVSPFSASLGTIADFLLHIFNSGVQVNTVRGYRTAIAAIHSGFPDGSSVSDSRTLNHLIKGMFHDRPFSRPLVPAWSLSSVLESLSKPPFEPLGSASLKNLTLKTVFLVALASGRRRGAIQALSTAHGHLVFTPHGVRLVPEPSFLAKNQTLDFTPEPIFLPKIGSFSSVREDKVWCPVRALSWYLDRTKPFRSHGETALFLTHQSPHRRASASTISRWIVETISSDKSALTGPGTPTAHDVRGVSASWALFDGVPVDRILQSAVWKNPNTFISCYLKDVLQDEGRFGRASLRVSSR